MQLTDRLKETLDYEELSNCMRCGFCQPACPTYRETGYEAASPRGRIALMKATVDGILQPDQDFIDQMSLCLGCRACEPVCPAGVQYGQLIEQAREAIEQHVKHPWWVRKLRTFAFTHLLPHQQRLYRLGKLLRFYQRSGLQTLVRKLRLLAILPKQMREMEAILPEVGDRPLTEAVGTLVPAEGKRRGSVGMFRGCIMDVMFHETNKNTVKLLSKAGFDVVIPAEQNCCGALHAHSGERSKAKELAKQNIRVFKQTGVDFIASNAGGCGALLKEYDLLLKDDREWKEEAGWFAHRVRDISELLLEEGKTPQWQPFAVRVTYQCSCHLRNGMHVTSQPQQLLQSIPGADYVSLFEAERCCGSAGIYNLVQPKMAGNLLDEKMKHVAKTKADVLVTSNPGCLLQMKAGIHRAGLDGQMKAVHLADLLVEASEKR